MESAQAFQLGKVHIEVSWVEPWERVHINLIEEQIFLDETRTGEVDCISHDERRLNSSCFKKVWVVTNFAQLH